MGRSKCDKCGEIVSDLDAGFSPGMHGMKHGGCGGTWRVIEESETPNVEGIRYAEQTRREQEEEASCND